MTLTILLVLAGVVGGAFTVDGREDLLSAMGVQPPPAKTEAPDFALTSLEGRKVGINDYRGKLILLNFWATWCVPCQWEMGEMETLYQAYKDKGFVVLAVSLDADGERSVKPFATERGLTYPILLDTKLEAARAYRIQGPPTTFLIGPQGETIGIALGPREWGGEKARALIQHLLAALKANRQP
jgi:peroxiredoxin